MRKKYSHIKHNMYESVKYILYLIVCFFICAVLVIGICEREYVKHVNSNWHDPNTQFDPEIGWSPIPDRHIKNEWGDISSNSLGFRSEEIDQNKKQVIVLGDSVVWGYGVGDTETMPYYLNLKLKPFDCQVNNLGVSGYSIDQYSLFLERHIDKFENLKYIILVIYTGNDFSETISNIAYGKRKPLYVLKKGRLELVNSPISRMDLRNFFSSSFILTALERKCKIFEKCVNLLVKYRKHNKEDGEKIIASLLEKIQNTAHANNASLIIVITPEKDDFTEKSQQLIWFQDFFHKKSNNYFHVDFFKTIREQDKNVDQLYIDNAHFASEGNKLFAQMLCGAVLNNFPEKDKG